MLSPGEYSESFKIQVVREIETGGLSHESVRRRYGIKGHSTILRWTRKYGVFSDGIQLRRQAMTDQDRQLMLLHNEVKELRRELEDSRIRNIVLETLVDVADRELGTDIRKKLGAKHAPKSK